MQCTTLPHCHNRDRPSGPRLIRHTRLVNSGKRHVRCTSQRCGGTLYSPWLVHSSRRWHARGVICLVLASSMGATPADAWSPHGRKPPRQGLHGTWDALPREPLLDARPWQAPTAAEAGRRAAGARAYLGCTMRWSAAISSRSSGAPTAPVRSVGWLTVGCGRLSCWRERTVWPSANDWGCASAWGRRRATEPRWAGGAS
jgi:hypothetical protein